MFDQLTNAGNGANLTYTVVDDLAALSINAPTMLRTYTGTFVPARLTSRFSNAQGDWYLVIQDNPDDNPTGMTSTLYPRPWLRLGWKSRTVSLTPVQKVNTTTAGNQMYSSVAMAYDGSFTIVWSGNGNQTESAGFLRHLLPTI